MAVNISSNIAPKSTLDTYATHIDNLGKGGVHSKNSIAERNSITTGRRSRLMLCTVGNIGDGTPGLYWLNTPPNPTLTQLANNQYWEPIPFGTSIGGLYNIKGFENASSLEILDSVGEIGDVYIVEFGGSVTNALIFEGQAVTLVVGDFLVYESNRWNVVATGSSATSWNALTGKPTTFDPSPHQHTISDITDFPDLSGYLTNSDIFTSILAGTTNDLKITNIGAIKQYVQEQIALVSINVDLELDVDSDEAIANSAVTTVVNQILSVIAVAPTYSEPTASLSNITPNRREVGQTFNLALSVGFTQNDAGSATEYRLLKDGVVEVTSATSISTTLSNVVVALGSTEFRGEVDYTQGPIKVNNLGINDATGRINGGTRSATRTLNGSLIQFFGSRVSAPTTSAQTRTLPLTSFDNVNILDLVTGTTNRFFIVAIPATKTITEVLDIGNLNVNITSEYVLTNTTFNVDDIGGTPRTYKLYVMELANPYPTSTTHKITLT